MLNRESQNSLLSSKLSARSHTSHVNQDDDIQVQRLRHTDNASDGDDIPVFEANGKVSGAAKRRKKKERKSFSEIKAKADIEPMQSAVEYDEQLELEADILAAKEERKAKVMGKTRLVVQIALTVLCAYIGFLIFGLVETRYVYNDSGNIVPEVLSVEDLRVLKEYNTLSSNYLRARIIYEDTLRIDYELSKASDSAYIRIAGKYISLLEDVDKLITDITANEKSAEAQYLPLYEQLLAWTKNDIAIYLQKIAEAISNNNAKSASEALLWRDTMYSDFSIITENMYYLGVGTKGCTNLEIYDWSPEAFSKQLVEED